MRISGFVLGLLSGAACLTPALANAQSANPQAASQPSATESGDIIVTAQRRAERLVDVPIAISVVSADQLKASGVSNSRDLKLVTPGLNFSTLGAYVQPTIRGIGTSVVGTGASANVASYVDGVYQPNQVAGLFDFNNIEQIQVLKGPQGTLYGRNATGGAIVVSTRMPSLTKASASAEVGYGSFNEWTVSGYANLPLGDELAANFAVFDRTNDGYTENVTTRMRVSRTDSFGVRGRLLFQPHDDLRFIVTGSHVRQHDNTATSYGPFQGNASITGTLAAQLGLSNDHDKVAIFNQPDTLVNADAVSLNSELRGEWGSLTSVTSWARVSAPFIQDQFGIEQNIQSLVLNPSVEQTVTQEITFTSRKMGAFSMIVGLAYFRDVASSAYVICVGANCASTSWPLAQASRQVTNAYAGYAEGTLDLSDRFHLTLGGRYTHEERQAQTRATVSGPLLLNGNKSWGSFTPRAALRYDITPHSSAYIAYTQGFKSGLFDNGNPSDGTLTCSTGLQPQCPSPGVPVNPEKVRSYEAGFKYNRGGLIFSTSAYLYDYSEIQLSSRNIFSGTIALYNAAKARIYGFEAEGSARLNQNWTIRGGATYTHARFTSFPNARDYTPLPANNGNASIVFDASGKRLIRTPDYTLFGSVNYSQPLPVGRLDSNVTVSHSGRFFWDPSNRLQQPAFTIVNAKATWVSPEDKYHISAFVNNLTDVRQMLYVRSGTNGDLVSYAPPRTWGVSIGVDF